MYDIGKLLDQHYNEIVEKIGEYNAALKENNFAAMSHVKEGLKEAEASYAEIKRMEVFTELAKSENPVKAAITTYSYLIVSHREKRNEDRVTEGFEIVDNKVRQIDLLKFCEFCNIPTMWQYAVERFNKLLALRTANELKMSKTQIKKLCSKFNISKIARQIELGETPDSNTAICRELQQILDGILFEDNGKGKNIYRANTHDVAYLLACYGKRGKKKLSIVIPNHAYIQRLIFDIAYRIVTNKVYDLEYRMIPAEKTQTEKPGVSEVSADKTT